MRVITLLALVACSVPDKQPVTDGGIDAPDGTDDRAPDTTITSAPAEFSRETAATFEFESDKPATFECSIDGEAPVACTSPYIRTLDDGAHVFAVRAIDAAGNIDESPAEHLWTIDTVAPQTFLTETPPAADNSVHVRFSFESDERNVQFECSVDNGGYSVCQSGDRFGPFSDGTHSFAVRARDRAGNVDASPAIHAWTVDTTTPDTMIVSGPEGPVAVTTATFTFVSPDAGAGATFQCALDGSGFTACTSPRTYTNLGAGPHTFEVRVRDAVGNIDPTPATRTWTVDLTPPNTMIIDGPEGVVAATSAIFTFTANESDVTYACRLGEAPFLPCTSPFTVNGLAQGPHTFAVRATDAAGHTDPTPATRSWTVDTIPPDVAITSGPAEGSTSGPHVRLSFTASDGAVTCSLDGAPPAPCASPLTLQLPAGPHQLVVRAVDAAGNTGTATRSWTVACAAPGPAGAVGLLHLDDTGQLLANAVPGGEAATLGDDLSVEPSDPVSIPGRFGRALAFTAEEGDRVAWPVQLPASSELALELWARPEVPGNGSRALLATADGRLVVRVAAAGGTNVRFSVVIGETGAQTRVVSSAPVAAGAWHHVIVSLAEPTLALWVDGVRTEHPNVRPGTPLAFDAISLGGDYNGALDEVWLAHSAITSEDEALGRYCPP
jgi:hypothetical protein